MRSARQRVIGFGWFVFMLILITCMFIASFYLTAALYRVSGIHPSPLLAQIINSLLGLLFTGLTIGAVGKFARAMGWVPERNVFSPIIDALEKIAKGDFSIRLENELQDNHIVGELTKSVNKMALELDQMESMRQEFISNVSHEIQSPLTSIGGFAQALENEHLSPEERSHYLAIIQAESMRLSRITEELLRMAALESDHLKFEPKSFRLDRQIRDLILACEPQWVEKQIDMQISLDEISIRADEDLLSQVWNNLIHNSLKFNPQGGRVWVELHRQAGRAEFKITDSGPGIQPEDQERVFERFYKADKSRTHSNGGSGLGLSIAKKIVEMHRGTIRLESQPGAGATFIVSLPMG
jgi:two-component system phosphate regulon sensor histidine kinase PhoR